MYMAASFKYSFIAKSFPSSYNELINHLECHSIRSWLKYLMLSSVQCERYRSEAFYTNQVYTYLCGPTTLNQISIGVKYDNLKLMPAFVSGDARANLTSTTKSSQPTMSKYSKSPLLPACIVSSSRQQYWICIFSRFLYCFPQAVPGPRVPHPPLASSLRLQQRSRFAPAHFQRYAPKTTIAT